MGYSPWGCVGHDLATKPPNHQVYFMPANVVQAVIPELPQGLSYPLTLGLGLLPLSLKFKLPWPFLP